MCMNKHILDNLDIESQISRHKVYQNKIDEKQFMNVQAKARFSLNKEGTQSRILI